MSVAFKISDFSEYLFWDIDVSKFDADKHASQLIHKVVEYGQLSDWNNLLQLYGKERIKETVVNLRSLSSVTLSFLAFYFKIQPEDFRCYTHKQSVQNYWNS